MSAAPTFTVIVPCFNGAATLDETLGSARAQTATDLEILVVDDGSTDDSAAIADRHAAADDRVRVVRETNRGVGAARNAGLALARGRYVSFLDADDLLEPEKLARQGQVLDAEPGVGLVICDGRVIDAAGRETWPTLVDLRRFAGHPPLLTICLAGGPFPPVVPLARTALVRAAGGFDEDRRVSGWADIACWMRLALAGLDYHVLPDRLVRYRSTSTSMSADAVAMRAAATQVYTTLFATHPADAARALLAVHERVRDLECARDDLRSLATRLLQERATVAPPAATPVVVTPVPAADMTAHRRDAEALVHALARESAGRRRPVWIWGAGAAGRQVQARLVAARGGAAAFVDSDPSRAGTAVEGVTIRRPADLVRAEARPYVIVASMHATAILPVLTTMGWREGEDVLVADFEPVLPAAPAPEVAA